MKIAIEEQLEVPQLQPGNIFQVPVGRLWLKLLLETHKLPTNQKSQTNLGGTFVFFRNGECTETIINITDTLPENQSDGATLHM